MLFWRLGFYEVFWERKLYCCILYFSLRMVKSLQVCGCKQITESRKYCLVCDYFSLAYIFFSIFASHWSENFVYIPITTIFTKNLRKFLIMKWLKKENLSKFISFNIVSQHIFWLSAKYIYIYISIKASFY